MLAYLVIARGVHGRTGVSSWSAEAVAKCLGIGWRKARSHVHDLVDLGYLKRIEAGNHPKYRLTANDADDGTTLWLPNALVDGVGDDGWRPLSDLRSTRDPSILRLLMEIYRLQDLPEHGGVPSHLYQRKFVVENALGQNEHYRFLTLSASKAPARIGRPFLDLDPVAKGARKRLTDRLEILRRLGLVEEVIYLMDGDDDEAEWVTPVALIRDGRKILDSPETSAGLSATAAALALRYGKVESTALDDWIDRPSRYLLPVRKTLPNAVLAGIMRTRFRAQTNSARKWWAHLNGQAEEHGERFRAITRKIAPELHTRLADLTLKSAPRRRDP